MPALGSVAQSVEQRTENPCVGGSIPPRATNIKGQPTGCPFLYTLSSRYPGNSIEK